MQRGRNAMNEEECPDYTEFYVLSGYFCLWKVAFFYFWPCSEIEKLPEIWYSFFIVVLYQNGEIRSVQDVFKI